MNTISHLLICGTLHRCCSLRTPWHLHVLYVFPFLLFQLLLYILLLQMSIYLRYSPLLILLHFISKVSHHSLLLYNLCFSVFVLHCRKPLFYYLIHVSFEPIRYHLQIRLYILLD